MAVEGEILVDDEGEEERELDRDAQMRRRLALAQIRQYPDAVLRMRAHEVAQFDDDLARLARKMAHLMEDARGVGLAATQVGVLQRLFVFHANGDEKATTIVNPAITRRSATRRGTTWTAFSPRSCRDVVSWAIRPSAT